LVNFNKIKIKKAVLRIPDVYPGSEFYPSGYRIRTKELKYFKPKIVSKLSEIWSGFVHPGSGSGGPEFFTHPGSRGKKGTGSRIRNTKK
jgi:hypothetical protein